MKKVIDMLNEPSVEELEAEVESMAGERATPPLPTIQGQFTLPVLKAFTESLNKALKAFGLDPLPLPAEPVTVLPEGIVAPLMMIKSAVDDALADEVVSPRLSFSPETITNDVALTALAGKLSLIGQDKDFKRWLKEQPEPTSVEVQVEVEQPAEMSDEDIDALFLSRMK